MRVERIRIGAFGRFADFDSGAEALPGLVVVLGPNEAGKSTLFHFLTTMLYGFHPASRDSNPYAPWGGEEATGGIRIGFDASGCAEIERLLRSQPSGKLTTEGVTEEIRNRALPWVDHVPRAVFSQVFAVTLGDLVGLEHETWAGIQDRLLGSMGSSDLLPARAVAGELEQEAGSLWRPHRRGNQRVRELQEEIRKLRTRRRDAAERDRELRDLVAELESSRERLTRAREERERSRVVLERVEALAPVRAGLVRISTLRAEGGPRSRLEPLGTAPDVTLGELDARLAELRSQREALDLEIAQTTTSSKDTGQTELFLSRSGDVQALRDRSRSLATDRARRDSLALDIEEIERELDQVAARIFACDWRDVPRGALATLSVQELRTAIRAVQTTRDEMRVSSSGTTASQQTPIPAWTWILAAVLGIAGLLGGWLLDVPFLLALGGAGVALASSVLFQSRRRNAPATSTGSFGGTESTAVDHARSVVRDLPVRDDLLHSGDPYLVVGLERAQALVRDHERRSQEWAQIAGRLDAFDVDARALASSLRMDVELDLDVLLQLFDTESRRTEREAEAADHGARERARLDRERQRIDEKIARFEGQHDALTSALLAFDPENLERSLELARDAIAAHTRADQLEDELERSHPDLDDLRLRIQEAEASGESWTVSDDDLARRRVAIQRLSDEIEETAARTEALDRDLTHSRGQETVDTVDGEIATLMEEENRLIRERDRRWVLAQLLRQADRRFREEHQPELIRRAGGYLKHLTGGRYDRIIVDETSSGDLFHVSGPTLTEPVPLTPPVSTGTLEQAYLSLRLAIVDHLDKGGERLPLFMDEAFVNWDPERRDRGMEVLTAVARSRQVFVFTCHPEVAEALSSAGAGLLELDRGS